MRLSDRAVTQILQWIVLLIFLVGPSVVLGFEILVHDRLTGLSEEPVALFVPVGTQTEDGSHPVIVRIERDVGLTVYAPAWSGLVTTTLAVPGEDLTDLDPVVVVDGVMRIAVTTDVPFTGSLRRGERGPSVKALQEVLGRLGLNGPGTADGVYGAGTARGVKQLANLLGAEPTDTFDSSWFVWLPVALVHVAQVEAIPGTLAPSLGETLLVGPSRIVSATLVTVGGGQVDLAGGASWEVDLPSLDLVAYVEPTGATLEPSSVAELASRIESLDQVEGTVRYRQALIRRTVPATAVYSTESGQSCIVVRGLGEEEQVAIPVDVYQSVLGTALLSGVLGEDLEVLANPSQVEMQNTCVS